MVPVSEVLTERIRVRVVVGVGVRVRVRRAGLGGLDREY